MDLGSFFKKATDVVGAIDTRTGRVLEDVEKLGREIGQGDVAGAVRQSRRVASSAERAVRR